MIKKYYPICKECKTVGFEDKCICGLVAGVYKDNTLFIFSDNTSNFYLVNVWIDKLGRLAYVRDTNTLGNIKTVTINMVNDLDKNKE